MSFLSAMAYVFEEVVMPWKFRLQRLKVQCFYWCVVGHERYKALNCSGGLRGQLADATAVSCANQN